MAIRGKKDPDWADVVARWKQTQLELRARMIVRPLLPLPRFVAGVDAAFSNDKTRVLACALVYDRVEQRVIEIARAARPIEVPYVPGFLSFREGPALIDAIRQLKHKFGAILFDGQGYAHPRRCGLAAHVAITLDLPGVGVAKSRLIGTFEPPVEAAGALSSLMDDQEQIGLVLRTRAGCRPLFVSIGHRVDLSSARDLVLSCCTRYRIPEPTRQADIEVGKMKRM